MVDMAQKHFSGKLIRARREKAGLTQIKLAEKTGMQRTWLIALESEGSNPTTSTLETIAKAIGCQVTDFYTDAKIKTKKGRTH